jgi:hypothetical protein
MLTRFVNSIVPQVAYQCKLGFGLLRLAGAAPEAIDLDISVPGAVLGLRRDDSREAAGCSALGYLSPAACEQLFCQQERDLCLTSYPPN